MAIAHARTAALFPMPPSLASLSKENHGLAVEARQLNHRPQRLAGREIERDDFVLGHAIQLPVRFKAQAARLPEPKPAIRSKDANKTAVGSIIFADGRHCVRIAKGLFTADDHVSVWRDREVERAEIRIPDLPGSVDRPLPTERQNGVIAFAARTDARCEKESAVLSEGKSAGEGDHCGWKHSFARSIERRRKRHDR